MKRPQAILIFPALLVVVLDQITKLIVAASLPAGAGISVIEGFLNLVHVRNRGMAFGMLQGLSSGFAAYLLAAASIIAVFFIIFFASRLTNGSKVGLLSLSLILGGALGNLVDRLRLGEVIDFVDVHIGQYHWPAFNVADSAITVGTLSVFITYLASGKKG